MDSFPVSDGLPLLPSSHMADCGRGVHGRVLLEMTTLDSDGREGKKRERERAHWIQIGDIAEL